MENSSRAVQKKDIPITPLFMLLFGVFTLVEGILLVPIIMGYLPYDDAAARGMFLVVFAIMIAFLGVTPIGTFRHSWPLFFVGLALSLLGVLSFLIPTTFDNAAGVALGVILLSMGFVRLPFYLAKKSQEFSALPPVYTVFYYFMHLICVILGLSILLPEAFPRILSAILLIVLGAAQLTLGVISLRIETVRPGTIPSATRLDNQKSSSVDIPLKNMIMLLLGVIMILMAAILFLGGIGIVVVDSSASSALFLFIIAMQIMLVGDTPVKSFAPSWPLVVLGILLATLSMVAAVVPGMLDSALGTAMGCTNLLSAVFGCARMWKLFKATSGHRPRVVMETIVTGLALYLLLFVFGINLLFPGLIPGIVMLAVMVFAGVMMIRLVFLMRRIDALTSAPTETQAQP